MIRSITSVCTIRRFPFLRPWRTFARLLQKHTARLRLSNRLQHSLRHGTSMIAIIWHGASSK
ncbi:hypothetical protein BCR44DRAFT_1434439 [Catenaria anguillulae PL171]|uniref:Uncharacterized protein n=1 Tax=Catenaria anguillulae PL171 TaxID=765915 RepID=A0A1Y2HLS4_9FUNG|nr:hypothetical protein BCR44DRAFT_1438569 [Catenaria anguillulae PL171]ORZ35540.1 hypothetical protein BCR44DRAFT_1434439 [Catenaria anguillulae PL171]